VIIYTPIPLEGYELCHPVISDGFELINLTINGEPRSDRWQAPKMQVIRQDQGRVLLPSDSPWLGSHALIFRQRGVDALAQLLSANGELLPMNDGLVIYNATRVIDALDEGASAITRFSSGKIMIVKRYVFRIGTIGEVDIFKIPNLRVSPTFVSRKFVDAWESSGLVGLGFKQVWASN
jgi:hypothetical protein